MEDMEVEVPKMAAGDHWCPKCEVKLFTPALREQHLAGKKHRARVLHLDQVERTVHISGWTGAINDGDSKATVDVLVRACNEFGNVEDVRLHESFAFVRFVDVAAKQRCEAAGTITVDVPASTDGKLYLNVRCSFPDKPGQFKKKQAALDRKMENVKDTTDMLMAVNRKFSTGLAPIQEQLMTVARSRKLDTNRLHAIEVAIEKVRSIVLHCFGQGSTAEPFGSFVSELGSKQSDIDISVSPADPEISDTLAMDCLSSACSSDPTFKVMARVHSKCSVLILRHLPTSAKCEISFRNKLSIANTRLVCAYLQISSTVALISHTIRLWVTTHSIKMSGYSATLLVIFYLQCRGLLPNLQEKSIALRSDDTDKSMKRKMTEILTEKDVYNAPNPKRLCMSVESSSAKSISDEEELWDTSHVAPAPHLSSNHPITVELMAGFFEFYHNFQWESNAVSIRAGQPIPRYATMCKAHRSVQTSILIEDPFELSHNTCDWMPPKSVTDFIQLCKFSAMCLMESRDVIKILTPTNRANMSPKQKLSPLPKHRIKLDSCSNVTWQWVSKLVESGMKSVGALNLTLMPKPDSIEDCGHIIATAVFFECTWRSRRKAKRASGGVFDNTGSLRAARKQDSGPPLFVADVSLYNREIEASSLTVLVTTRQLADTSAFQEFFCLFKRKLLADATNYKK